jgi:phospholipid transport system substrate-binding protein
MSFYKAAWITLTALFVSTAGLSQVALTESKAQDAGPGQFIQTLGNRAIKILSSPNRSIREREEKFREILRDDFAMDKIGRFVAGRYWREMTPKQKRTYQKLFSEWVLKTYSIRLGGYSDEKLRVIKTTSTGKRDVIVQTRIEKASGDGFITNWRVRRVSGRYVIIDVYIEGVSMAVTQRSEFDAVFRRRGVDGLINLLRDRLSELSAAS